MSFGYIRKFQLLDRIGREEEAQETLRNAVRHSPQDPRLRTALASALTRSGAIEKGESEFQRAIDLQPDNWHGHFGLGTTLLRAGKFGPARDALTRAARLAPDRATVHQALGAALSGLGEHAKAAKTYDEALRLEPSNMRSVVGGAMARSASGLHQEALDMLRNVGRLGNRVPPVQKALGDVCMAMGRYADAVDVYRAMILNSRRMGENNPDLVALARSDGDADPEAFAKRLQEGLSSHMGAVGNELRANPNTLRERLMSRRRRRA